MKRMLAFCVFAVMLSSVNAEIATLQGEKYWIIGDSKFLLQNSLLSEKQATQLMEIVNDLYRQIPDRIDESIIKKVDGVWDELNMVYSGSQIEDIYNILLRCRFNYYSSIILKNNNFVGFDPDGTCQFFINYPSEDRVYFPKLISYGDDTWGLSRKYWPEFYQTDVWGMVHDSDKGYHSYTDAAYRCSRDIRSVLIPYEISISEYSNMKYKQREEFVKSKKNLIYSYYNNDQMVRFAQLIETLLKSVKEKLPILAHKEKYDSLFINVVKKYGETYEKEFRLPLLKVFANNWIFSKENKQEIIRIAAKYGFSEGDIYDNSVEKAF